MEGYSLRDALVFIANNYDDPAYFGELKLRQKDEALGEVSIRITLGRLSHLTYLRLIGSAESKILRTKAIKFAETLIDWGAFLSAFS